ncbi:hypothetical protein M6B38_411010 [Iris pallida]|uniref:Uncharacterized protein n=1 Tax=Iris pallida TaxID=29817 RepID=A0AAX6FNL5_IRIPA|nr:hypothetical protein M6B38_411010 [Iris pallida]
MVQPSRRLYALRSSCRPFGSRGAISS